MQNNRTAVFVDGYNLYYGRLRGTEFKWLDLVALSKQILAKRAQGEILTRVCFCTARISSKFATHPKQSVESQGRYHRALEAINGDQIKIVYGEHSWSKTGTDMPRYCRHSPFDRKNTVRVWKIEEKMTDVNLALSMYRECAQELCDRLILISNDRDISPALKAIKNDFPKIQRGVILPLKPLVDKDVRLRRPKSGTLQKDANWSQSFIDDSQLLAAQMPVKVPVVGKKTIVKPDYW